MPPTIPPIALDEISLLDDTFPSLTWFTGGGELAAKEVCDDIEGVRELVTVDVCDDVPEIEVDVVSV